MQSIRSTQALNKAELAAATPPSASWHRDYSDTAYVYIGGLPLDLSEGDVVTIFSQFGNPTHLNLIRDKESGKSKGFAFLKYEDQRSCDLAVDNLGGAKVFDRLLRVDHTRYKKKDDEDEETYRIDRLENQNENEVAAVDTDDNSDHVNKSNGKRLTGENEDGRRKRKRPKILKEEEELEAMLAIKENGEDEEDPMREYLIREKREDVERAKARIKESDDDDGERRRHGHRHRHRQHPSHRSRRGDEEDDKDRKDNDRSKRNDRRDYESSRRRRDKYSDDEDQDQSRRRERERERERRKRSQTPENRKEKDRGRDQDRYNSKDRTSNGRDGDYAKRSSRR